MKLIDNWRAEIRRLWTMRVVICSCALWSSVGGMLLVWPALADHIPVGVYVAGGLVLSVAFGLARMTKQPGADE